MPKMRTNKRIEGRVTGWPNSAKMNAEYASNVSIRQGVHSGNTDCNIVFVLNQSPR